MNLHKKIIFTFMFTLFVTGFSSIFAQGIDIQNGIETEDAGSDMNSIRIPEKKKRKKKKKVKVSASDLKKAAEMKDNARYRKKRSTASKKCKKAVKKKTCGNKKAEELLKKSKK